MSREGRAAHTKSDIHPSGDAFYCPLTAALQARYQEFELTLFVLLSVNLAIIGSHRLDHGSERVSWL